MEISTKRETLLKLVKSANKICSKVSFSDLTKVCIKADGKKASIYAASPDMQYCAELDSTNSLVKDDYPIYAAVPCKLLLSILEKSTDDYVTISADSSAVKVNCGNVKAKLPASEEADAKNIEALFKVNKDEGNIIYIKPEKYNSIVKYVLPAAAKDDARSEFKGVWVECENGKTLRFVTTNGHSLHLVETAGEFGIIKGRIIPTDALNLFAGAKEVVAIGFYNHSITFTCGNEKITSLYIAGQFPDFSKVISKTREDYKVMFPADEFRALVAQASITAPKTGLIVFNVNKDGCELVSSDKGSESSVKSENSGTNQGTISFGLCLNYIIPAIVQGTISSVRFLSNDDPVYITSEKDGIEYAACIMTMQL